MISSIIIIIIQALLHSTTTVLPEGWLWHWITHEDWYTIKQKNLNWSRGNIETRFICAVWLGFFV